MPGVPPVITPTPTSPAAPRTPSLAELLKRAIDYTLDDLHVMLPGTVTVYDPSTQKVNVTLLIQRRVLLEDGREMTETLPDLVNVPVLFPRGGGTPGFFISFPIQPGDNVMIVFAERSLDAWLNGPGTITDPNDFRRHDLSDAVAIPGLYPFTKPLADASPVNMALGMSGGPQVHFDTVNVHVGGFPAADFAAKAQPTESRLAALETFAASHVHTSAAPGSPTSPAAPPFVAVATPVAATIAKVT